MIGNADDSNDKSRRTFLKALGGTGAATASIGMISNNAAATSTTQSMNPLDIKVDDIVPANKYLSITLLNNVTEKIKKANVLVNDTQISSVQRTSENTFLLSVFDVLTNTDLENLETVPVELQAVTASGNNLVGTDMVNVIDPTNVLDEATNQVDDAVDSTGLVGNTADDVLSSADSTDILDEATNQVDDAVDSTGLVGDTAGNVLDSVDSNELLG